MLSLCVCVCVCVRARARARRQITAPTLILKADDQGETRKQNIAVAEKLEHPFSRLVHVKGEPLPLPPCLPFSLLPSPPPPPPSLLPSAR